MSGKTRCSRGLTQTKAGLGAVLALALGLWIALALGVAYGSEPLRPNLVADPPDNVLLETSTTEGGVTKEGEAKLLLRFNGYVHNIGPGAVDFRGRREAPKVSRATIEEVERAKEKEEGLPQKTEDELAVPPMQVFQRLFATPVGVEETNIERAHVDEPSAGEMIYVSADGHHHWHLQRVAKYSLFNAAKTAQVAPAQKAGFCLEDSEHVESSVGPGSAVYSDNVAPYRDFCQRYNPDATSLFEGISAGWRDAYRRNLAFQWVDVSKVLPGEYWLREDVNPLSYIKETGGANSPAYATSRTIIPGFDALAQSTSTQAGEATTVTLTSKAWNDSATPKYAVVSQPQHGTLQAGSANNQVIYRPASGYTGQDSFTFLASDPNSPFPRNPAIATVSIEILPAGGRVLLAGDSTTSYSVADQTRAGREEAFQFTAKSTGTVEELQFRTNGTANTGVTGLSLGVFADNAGKPGEVLGGATVTGQPPTGSWIKAGGLSVPVASGTKYWLVALPLGETSNYLHYNVAAAVNAGTGNLESIAGGLTTLTAESSWETFNQGPLGFQAIGTAGSQPSVTIEGAPASMTAGTSAQLTAHVVNDSPTVSWKASAGSITTGGLYTAPSQPPSGGSAVIMATTSKGAQATVSIEILPAGGTVLLAGDSTSTYSVAHHTAAGREEAFQFIATSTGTVQELQFRTNGRGDPGITGLSLGVFADNAGKPGEVLGRSTVTGQPATSSWIKAGGLSVPVASGTKYWLVELPLGSKYLRYNVAAAVGAGTGNLKSTAGGLSTLTAESSWKTYNQGPVGFQAIGAVSGAATSLVASGVGDVAQSSVTTMPAVTAARPAVMIEGVPSSLTAGTAIQLAAVTAPSGASVSWHASAGAITPGGVYTAPSDVPRDATVALWVSAGKARDERRITIAPVESSRPAPAAPPPSPPAGAGRGAAALTAPRTVLIDGKLIMTTMLQAAGRARLSAYLGRRRLGSCVVKTPANRSFTCRLKLAPALRHAPISRWASLRIGARIISRATAADTVAPMAMPLKAATALGLNTSVPSSARFVCGRLRGAARPARHHSPSRTPALLARFAAVPGGVIRDARSPSELRAYR
jgi:hypothetical protein